MDDNISKKTVFEFNEYKKYLINKLEHKGARRGNKALLSQAINIQAAYLSKVLNGDAHLNLEQADLVNDFFLHSQEESHFFFLLLQKDRAGTKKLRKYFEDQLDEIKKRRLTLTQRLGKQEHLSDDEKLRYYSSWIFAAVHIAVTIPELRTKDQLAAFLGVSRKKIVETLEFLIKIGLVSQEGNFFLPGSNFIRLGNDSHNIIKHHTNWRLRAIESLDIESVEELHYSSVVSLSSYDVLKIKNAFLDFIKDQLSIIRESKEERLYSMCLDFFDLKKQA